MAAQLRSGCYDDSVLCDDTAGRNIAVSLLDVEHFTFVEHQHLPATFTSLSASSLHPGESQAAMEPVRPA
jgi:hypothetical protein